MRRQKDVMILPSLIHILLVIICQQRMNSRRSECAKGKQNPRYSKWSIPRTIFMELVKHLGVNIFFEAFSQSSSAFYREGLRQPLRCLNRLRLEFLSYFSRFTYDFFLFYLSRKLLCCTRGAIQISIIRRLITLEVAFLPLNESKPSFKDGGWNNRSVAYKLCK